MRQSCHYDRTGQGMATEWAGLACMQPVCCELDITALEAYKRQWAQSDRLEGSSEH